MGRRGRRRRLPGDELSLLLAAARGPAGGRLRAPVAALLGALPRALGRPRAARGGGAVPRLPRAGDGESALVPGAGRRRAAPALQLHRQRARRAGLRPGARQRILRMSFAVWLTGYSGSGKSAIARELL